MLLLKNLSIQSKLILLLLAVTIFSILFLTGVVYWNSHQMLQRMAIEHLSSIRIAKAHQIEEKIATIRHQSTSLSHSLDLVQSMRYFRAGFTKLQTVTFKKEEEEKLLAYYRDIFIPELKKDYNGEPVLDSFIPPEPVGRYLQYHYLAKNDKPVNKKYLVEDAGDGSEYSASHRTYHSALQRIVSEFGYDNLFLVDSDTGQVVYSTKKSPVFAVNILTGTYSASPFADLVRDLRNQQNDLAVVIKDFFDFVPALNQPIALIGCPIFDGSRQIGIMVLQLPIKTLDRILNSNNNWKGEGLGLTGDVYLVGEDHLLRSNPRLFLEDSELYFNELIESGYGPDVVDDIRRCGSTLLNQSIRTPAISNSLAGKEGTETMTNYRGRPVLTSYSMVNVPKLRWAIVSELETSEIFAPLRDLTRKMLYTAVLIILGVTALAGLAAYYFVRPFQRLIQGVRRLEDDHKADSNYQQSGTLPEILPVDESYHDEYNDLSKVFNTLTKNLHSAARRIRSMARENDQLLLNVLPTTIASRYSSRNTHLWDQYPDLTVISADLVGLTDVFEQIGSENGVELYDQLIASVDEAAERHGIEKIRTSGCCYLAAADLSGQGLDAGNRAIDFARDFLRLVRRLAHDPNHPIQLHVAIHSGPVTGGIIGGNRRLGYDLFGQVIDLVKVMMSQTPPDTILITERIKENLSEDYLFGQPVEIVTRSQSLICWPIESASSMPRPGAENH